MNKFLKLSTALCFGIILTLTLVVGAQAADMTIDGKLTVTGDIHAQSPIYLRGNNIYMTGDSGKKMLEMNNYGNSYSVYSDHQGLHIASTGDIRISDGLYTYFQGNASFENSADFQNGLSLSAVPVTASASELNVLDGVIVSTTELNYLDGVTSAVQTQLDSKFNNTGGVLSGNLVVTGTLGASGVTTLSGAANLASTLTVANASWLQDTLYVQDGASGNAVSFDYDGTQLTIAYYDGASTDLVTISNAGVFTTTGGLVIGGTLDVTGATTLNSTLGVTGNTTLQGTLTTGNISAYGAGDNANLTINAKGTGTIGIGNVSTGAVAITPNTTITGTLGVTGISTFNSSVTTLGSLIPNANITFTNSQAQTIGIAQSAEDVAGRSLSVGAGNAGATTGAGLAGGDLYLFAGSPSTGGNAGDVWMFTDHGGSLVNGGSTHGGDIYIATGNGVGAAGNAGDIIIQPGNGAGTGSDGALLFANDKNQTIKVDRSATDTHGMDLTISAGQGGLGVTNGGDIVLTAGSGNGGADGAILIGATNTDHIHIGTILILKNGEEISNDIDNNITFSNDTDNDLTFEMQAGTNKDFIIDLDGSGHTWVKRFPMHMVFTVPGRNNTASTMGVRANTFSKALVVDRFDVYNQATPAGGATPGNDVVVTVTGDAAQSCTVAGDAGAGAGCSQTTDVALATLSNPLTVNVAANGVDDSANTYTVVLTYFYNF